MCLADRWEKGTKSGGGGGIARAPSPFPRFGRNLKKEEDNHFTVENTE